MKNINIPEPCSENWNEMTPSQKGAFCQKCALDVYDFTKKSGDEIRDILTLNIGSRVCGRINPTQLEELNTDFSAWQIDNKQSFQRAWLFTLLVVFGMTLFSCEEEEGLAVEKFQKIGQVVLAENVKKRVDQSIDVETTKGEMKSIENGKSPASTLKNVHPEAYEHQMLGEMVIEEEPIILEEVQVIAENPRYLIKGAMISTDYYTEHLLQRTNEGVQPVTIIQTEISGLMYPNPATNESTLKVNMPSREKAEIQLVGLNGQKIRTVFDGNLKKGETEFPIDLTDLETGLYLVVIHSGDKKVTVKFSKI